MALPDRSIEDQARARQGALTKPAGALGRLEDLACWLAARLGGVAPAMPAVEIFVFAADHGVANRGVSAYPQSVTEQMVHNFTRGGAAINVLARLNEARIEVVDVGVASDEPTPSGARAARIGRGTRDLVRESAMTDAEVAQAFEIGGRCVDESYARGARLLIAGEMGIGNTTSAACLICALTGAAPADVVGRGTGIDDEALARKREAAAAALDRLRVHERAAPRLGGEVLREVGARLAPAASLRVTPVRILAELGGYELATITGFYLAAARRGVPVILDGYLSAAAALMAVAIEPNSREWMLASHRSAELGHAVALRALELDPLVDFNLRLGEGSGAALSLSIVRAALALHREMATFAQAGVSGPAT
jgi:nicotinate-nucleotide--dimethylbenzimidazole phosphoribosyltransferase